jgi:hypothetical protein
VSEREVWMGLMGTEKEDCAVAVAVDESES